MLPSLKVLQKPIECFTPTPCPLAELDKAGFSEVTGTGISKVMIVGEALGSNERAEGRAFVESAEAGSLLQRAFNYGGYSREEFSMNNVIRCQPPGNKLEGAWYEWEAIKRCNIHFTRSVNRFQPKCFLALGNTPLHTLTGMVGEKQGISLLRGFVLNSTQFNIPVVASFHPSYINRGNKHLTGVLIRDIGLAKWVASLSEDQIADYRDRERVAEISYILAPSVEDAWGWANMAINSNLPITYDIETNYSSEIEDESELEANALNQRIIQIQFSVDAYSGIAMPYTTEFKPIIAMLLESMNAKWGWNNYCFDDPILRREGFVINGEIHDLMNAWHHLQPDLPKGLQFATSFYAPFFQPWKHLSGANLALYGVKDVDAPQRVGVGVFRDLRAANQYDSYMRYYVRLQPILTAASDRGLPVDRVKQSELRGELEAKMQVIDADVQSLIPDVVRDVHPKLGYKKVPKEILELITRHSAITEITPAFLQDVASLGYIKKSFNAEARWCKLIDFNLNSHHQVIRYIEWKATQPGCKSTYKVPTKRGTGKKTVEEDALQRLYNKTNDPVLGLALQRKKMSHFVSAFCSSDWTPKADGRVHTTFKSGGTATGQLSGEKPNTMHYPRRGDLAKLARGLIYAPTGYKLITFDYDRFHIQTLAWNAKDPTYARMGKLDIHAFVAGHMLKLEGRERWASLSDQELKPILEEIATKHSTVRSGKAKTAVLGIGLGLGPVKLFEQNRESFDSIKEAKSLISLLKNLFPGVFSWQEDIARIANRDRMLRSKHDCVRYFWEVYRKANGIWSHGEDKEAAIAFYVQNDAHSYLKEGLLRCNDNGWLDKYGLINIIHDEIVMLTRNELVDECIMNIKPELEKPSDILVDSVMGAFSCSIEVKTGDNWGDMRRYAFN